MQINVIQKFKKIIKGFEKSTELEILTIKVFKNDTVNQLFLFKDIKRNNSSHFLCVFFHISNQSFL